MLALRLMNPLALKVKLAEPVATMSALTLINPNSPPGEPVLKVTLAPPVSALLSVVTLSMLPDPVDPVRPALTVVNAEIVKSYGSNNHIPPLPALMLAIMLRVLPEVSIKPPCWLF